MDALELGTGITSVTLLCASTIAGPPAPVVTVTVTAPATPTSRAQTSEDEDFEEQLRAAEQLIVTCDSVVSDVLKLAKEQNSGGPMLIGIKNRETLLERELDLTRDGWVLKCQGLGVVSGRKNTPIYYGFQMEDGKAFVVHESQN